MIQVEYADYYISKEHFTADITPSRIVGIYEIELMKTDVGITFLNGEQSPHKKRNMIIALPGDIRRTKNSFECYSVKFTADEDDSILPYLKNIAGVKNGIGTNKIESVYKEIQSAFLKNSSCRELYLDAKVRELVSLIYTADSLAGSKTKYSQHFDAISACTEFINKNYAKNPDLACLAKIANLSPTFFHTVFKSIIGKTPYEYITSCRIQNALMMLENSTLSIDEIASACGFSSRQYFDTVFKKQTGETPFQYRRAILV